MFNEKYSTGLEMFSVPHIIILLIFFLISAVFFIFIKKFTNPKVDKIARYSLASVLLVLESGFHIWTATMGGYGVDMVPVFTLCSLTNALTIIALYTNSSKIIVITAYWAFCGAFFSLIFIDTSYMPPHYRFFHYFIVHFGFMLESIYFIATKKAVLKRRDVNLSCIIIFSLSVIMLVLDIIFKKNWWFMLESPVKEISDTFGKPWYSIAWIITIGAMINGWYYLIKLIYFISKKRQKQKEYINN